MHAKLRTRAEALAAGEKRYFSGKPCPKGHIEDRFAVRSVCVECHRLCAVERYLRNREAAKARIKAWGKANQEKVRGYKRAYKARRKAAA